MPPKIINFAALGLNLPRAAAPVSAPVPNSFPPNSSVPYRIAFVGDSPGEEEEKQKKPFVGAAGRFLTVLCIDAGIDRRTCFVGNLTSYRPEKNDIKYFKWTGPEIQTGLAQLTADLRLYQPNLVVLLGPAALRAAKGTYLNDKNREKTFSLSDFRGTVFVCDLPGSPMFGFKCLATYHPQALFRNQSAVPLTRFDLKRARKEGCTRTYVPPVLSVDVDASFDTLIGRLRAIATHKLPFAMDIEGWQGTLPCLSISVTPNEAFIVPFVDRAGNSVWTLEQEVSLWDALSLILTDSSIPKTLQNAMYDRFVLAFYYRMLVCGVTEDTMLKAWELFCELDKDLGTLVSLYTDHPFYKDQRTVPDTRAFWAYCCKDSAVTNEISRVQGLKLTGSSLAHYRFNVALLNPFLFIELKGMRLDHAKLADRIKDLQSQAFFDNNTKPKTSYGTEQILLENMVGWQINISSPADTMKLLYDQLKLPIQYKKRADGERTPTGDFETLLNFGHKQNHPVLLQAIKVRRIKKRTSDLESCTVDSSGRIRSSINVVGTVTGRTSCSAAPTGYGTNLQTIRDIDRDIFIADPGYDFCQCDLSGADGWTVAAHCARLGDPTMLDDYNYGLKPAKILALMYLRGKEVNSLSRAEIKTLTRDINAKTDPQNNYLYYSSKRVQHGSNYLMEAETLSKQVYLDTDGEVSLPIPTAKTLQGFYKFRYGGLPKWHTWLLEEVLKKDGSLLCASGHRRIFFGRKDDNATHRDACAEEPQHNTTWVTNLALFRLWTSPENRNPDGSLIIWPCHHVHDALCLQWPSARRTWAISQVREFFNNPVIIAGIRLTIPFEGGWGPNWKDCDNEI